MKKDCFSVLSSASSVLNYNADNLRINHYVTSTLNSFDKMFKKAYIILDPKT